MNFWNKKKCTHLKKKKDTNYWSPQNVYESVDKPCIRILLLIIAKGQEWARMNICIYFKMKRHSLFIVILTWIHYRYACICVCWK